MARFRVIEICKEKGITQKSLAEKIGLSPIGLSKAINGNPTFETMEKIAFGLGVSITDLFTPPVVNSFTCPHCGKPIKIEKGE